MICPLCDALGAVVVEEELVLLVTCPRCSTFIMTRAAAVHWKHVRGPSLPSALVLAWKHIVRKSGETLLVTLSHTEAWVASHERTRSQTREPG